MSEHAGKLARYQQLRGVSVELGTQLVKTLPMRRRSDRQGLRRGRHWCRLLRPSSFHMRLRKQAFWGIVKLKTCPHLLKATQ